MIRSVIFGTVVGLALLAEPAQAQGRSHASVPRGHLPPAGMCRVWVDGVPPGRQPGISDCRTARQRAARYGGRVIYGDDYAYAGNGKSKGKYKNKDRGDDRYGRRDRDDDRWDDRRRDRDDDRWDDRRRDAERTRTGSTCVDANRNGRCDYAEARTPAGTTPTSSRVPTSGRSGTSIYEAIGEAARAKREREANQR